MTETRKVYFLQSAEQNMSPLPSGMPRGDTNQFLEFLKLAGDKKHYRREMTGWVYFKLARQEGELSRFMNLDPYRYFRVVSNGNRVNEIFLDKMPSEAAIKRGTIASPERLEIEYLTARIAKRKREHKTKSKKVKNNKKKPSKKKKSSNKKIKRTSSKKKTTTGKKKKPLKKKKSTIKKRKLTKKKKASSK
jgi:hypothetical protein